MTIIRVDKSAGRWEAIPVALINDPRLSLEARGFAAWLMTRGESWEVQARTLPKLLNVGRDRAQRFLRELEATGYLTRHCSRGADGRWVWASTFTPTPTANGFPVNGSPPRGSPVNGKPVHIDKTRKSSRLRTTTTRSSEGETDVIAADLRIPELLEGDYLASTLQCLRACPLELRQPVLDEVAGLDAKGDIRRNRIALLSSLVSAARGGTFVAAASIEHAHRVARRKQSIAVNAQPPPRQPLTDEERQIVRQRVAKLRSVMTSPNFESS